MPVGREMVKVDYLFLLSAYCLRMTVLLLYLVTSVMSYFYEYWFNTSNNAQVRRDSMLWLVHISFRTIMLLLYAIHIMLKLLIGLPQMILGGLLTAILWWPKFYWNILSDPDGRSLWNMFTDPRFRGSSKHSKARISRHTKRQFIAKGKVKIQPTHARHNVYSSYQVHGAYAHVGQNEKQKMLQAVAAASKDIYFDDPLRLSVPYNYVMKRIPEPPDNDFMHLLACLSIVGIYCCFAVYGIARISWYRISGKRADECVNKVRKCKSSKTTGRMSNSKSTTNQDQQDTPSTPTKRHVLATESDEDDVEVSYFDTDGITFVIDNSANCIICNDRTQFVGELIKQACHVNTAAGISNSQYVGTIRVVLKDDAGASYTYDVPDAIYDPDSPFNIMGIPALGEFFGKGDTIPTSDDDGTYVTSSATRSTLVWDHGKHTRTFVHSSRRLPELTLETGFNYFSAFCTRVRRHYYDNVSYAFSSAHSIPSDEDEESAPAVVTPVKDFELGSNIYYKDGFGNNETVVYEGESADGHFHTVRKEDGTKVVTPASHLRDMDQPDLCNIPSTPLEYCQEIGKGLTKEEVQSLAYPRILSPLQQELMSWHHRLYHLPIWRILLLAEKGYLPKRLLKCQDKPPKCIACEFGTAHRRPWRTKGKKSGSIRKDDQVKPGDGTSVDQIVSAQPGLIPQMAGFLTSDRIWGATTFCDHVSDFVYVHLMRNFTLEETLLAKKAYEKLLAQAGRKAKHYQADNGRFSDVGFQKDITDHDQTISFCGVGAHHQNGIIENKNKQLTLGARTLLLHGIRYWPQMIDTMFWPFAMKAYAERMNRLHMDSNGETPESKLHGVKPEDIPVSSYHTLFCPVYVLDARLQSAGGAGPPKWEPRSRIGVYLGHSPFHAGSVALVFNPTTGRVSPQYHVVFDDDFTTVPYMERGELPPNWADLCQHSYESSTDESVDLALEWLAGQEITNDVVEEGYTSSGQPIVMGGASTRISDPFAVLPDQHPATSASTSPNVNSTLETVSEGESEHSSSQSSPLLSTEGTQVSPQSSKRRRLGVGMNLLSEFNAEADRNSESRLRSSELPITNTGGENSQLFMPPRVNLHEAGLRRSERIRAKQSKEAKQKKAHTTFGTRIFKSIGLFALLSTVGEQTMPSHPLPNNATFFQRVVNRMDEANECVDGTLNQINYHAFSADVGKNETFTFHQAMQQDDRLLFIEAMEKEIADHEERDHWTIVERSTIPKTAKTIKAIWSFKRKRFPDGRLNKHKARICAHGGMQQWGENYWETYSPVVNAMTVKLLLVIAKIHGLESKSIDFVLAFPQAELDVDIWMDLPIGFEPQGVNPNDTYKYTLKLNKSLYGLKQASFNWYEKLKAGLEDRDFVPSEIDPCLYLNKRSGMMVLTYVDDCIIIGNDMKDINDFVYSMQHGKEKFVLTDEGDIDKFLGIEITHRENGEFEMSQPFLIDRILKFLQLEDNGWETSTKGSTTPAAAQILNKDLSGKPRKKSWGYRTAVGMLSYLQCNTRPDISMAVHQTARFCINPMLSHEQAITRIGRYLRHTRTRGIVYKPDKTKGLECFVDADFAGGWDMSSPDDASNLMSRTGFVLKYAGCPIYWCSKLQTEIALSTAEAEYIALSSALREVIPLMTMMLEINDIFPLHICPPDFYCTVWEDNQSCIAMATSQKFSPRTKHIALKYHHFRSYVMNKKIRINYVHTESQEADIFTKPVKNELFPKLRYLLCGW